MKTYGVILAATLCAAGCGAEPEARAPSVAGHWTFELAATDSHSACTGSVTLTERGPDQIAALQPGQTYIDGLWSCSDGTNGIMGGTRVDNSIGDFALDIPPEDIRLRSIVDVTALTMEGIGFRAQRD